MANPLMVEPSETVKIDKWCTNIVLMLCMHFQIYYHMVVIFITSYTPTLPLFKAFYRLPI